MPSGGEDMAEASDARELFRQNLIDAGCGQEVVSRCMELREQQNTAQLMRVLARHRRSLLDRVHAGQKQIDCLDYLIYWMEKTQGKNAAQINHIV